ncbi:DNA gyrase subunit A [Candidatus Oleimmundimicrobium sp.]|uniref:DNA gyrase subunit A n=1 Tax=Candidatus Oleimmundimicrobium sp. TaxID=3060597 RepID=UPI0027275F79|nr:DNA gyrase subunit A [Candidatus Oleimmundimicrobium sp.]MDO8886375.1 DNA gyrase subunit A [Candidatus Oleimmundimicrobium sp.]
MDQDLTGRIEPVYIEEEMKRSYIDYAMSVIVGRALPDVRDGLKPVHRRILYGMYDMGMVPGKSYMKCARIVGEVLGKYHPHGDSAVYDALVRMAQDFSLRYELIDGHGNFGSVDGDSAAAMRYTEARLSKLAIEMLRDINKDTVNFIPNFDETLVEPAVLPSKFPNLLVNGSSGIAVGMATNIPPHNLKEVIEATIAAIDDPEVTIEELMKKIKGPDFPTGGLIVGSKGIQDAYRTGRGNVLVRGKTHIEQTATNREHIIVTEIPFQVNKARLTEKIAELVRDKKIMGISDLRDESDRDGMRLVIELKRDAIPQVVLNKLYKYTQLQTTFNIIMLALVDSVPRVLALPEVIHHYLNHQKEIITRRTKFDLRKAEARAHILEGLLVALNNLDEIIKTIKQSQTVELAKKNLTTHFDLSEEQAQAILDMKLQKLTGLEREKIRAEHKELLEKIAYYKKILADESKVLEIIKSELLEIESKFADERRTQIIPAEGELNIEDLIVEEEMVVTITHSGYIKRLPVGTYKQQHRGGRGVIGMDLKDGDFVEHLFVSSTHDYVLFFSNKGKVYRVKVYELPLCSRTAKGQAIVNVLPFESGEKIAAVIAAKGFEEGKYLIMATKKGLVKKTEFEEYHTARTGGIIALTLREGDELIEVKLTNGGEDIILVSQKGQAIRFKEENVRSMGRTASGVRGLRLDSNDAVLGMDVIKKEGDLFVVTNTGYGKRTPLSQYHLQGRGGKGVRTIKRFSGKQKLAGMKIINDEYQLMLVSSEGQVIKIPAKGVSRMSRSTKGVKIINLKKGDSVSAVARMVKSKPSDDDKNEEDQLS